MKKIYFAFCVLFFAFLLALGVLTVALPQRDFSPEENRILKTRDTLDTGVLSGAFQTDFEDMLSDQFPLRLFCVKAQTGIKLALGRRDIGGTYVLKSGEFSQRITTSDIDLDAVASHAARYARAADRAGVPLTFMPVPSRCASHPGELPYGAETYDYGAAKEAIAPSGAVVDLCRDGGAEKISYYGTDHHWDAYGAYAAYSAWCVYHGTEPTPLSDFSLTKATDSFYGSLYSKAPGVQAEPDEIFIPAVPDGITVTADGKKISLYDLSALEEKDKYKVFFGGNHGIVEIENPASDGGVLLIFKDSFANSLVPYLVERYGKIVMIDERYVTVDLAAFAVEYGVGEIAVIKEAAFF